MEIPTTLTLQRSSLELPGSHALTAGRRAYAMFSETTAYIEPLVRFAQLTQETVSLDLDERADILLTQRGLLRKGTGSLAVRLTTLGHTARAMIVPDIVDDFAAGYLQEPFVNYSVLEEWHQAVEAVRKGKAKEALISSGFPDLAETLII